MLDRSGEASQVDNPRDNLWLVSGCIWNPSMYLGSREKLSVNLNPKLTKIAKI